MRTEEEIVYDLLNIVSGGRVSNDDTVSERLVSSFIRKHRAAKLNKFFNKGMNIDDYVFQSLGEIELNEVSENMFSAEIPALIHFENAMGIKIRKNDFRISVLGDEEFQLALSNLINKSTPKAKLNGQILTVFKGYSDSCDFYPDSPKEKTVALFDKETAVTDDVKKISVQIEAVLYDPKSAPGYDWTKDPYPCPSEIIDQIETSVLARDFDLLIRTRSDQADNKSQIDPVGNTN